MTKQFYYLAIKGLILMCEDLPAGDPKIGEIDDALHFFCRLFCEVV